MFKNAMILVSHREAKIPIRTSELPIWNKMTFAERADMVKTYREALKTSKIKKTKKGYSIPGKNIATKKTD